VGYVASTEQLAVEVFVRDIARATAFYRRLGFELLEDRGDFVQLGWEGHRFLLDEHRDLPPLPAAPAANVRVMVPDVDACWRVANEIGAAVVSPIADRAYGLRDLTVRDPDGFGVRFASRLAR
jgi:catechol 2,3-dioxygenase-like lactoylglutathione lyase family enzyme